MAERSRGPETHADAGGLRALLGCNRFPRGFIAPYSLPAE